MNEIKFTRVMIMIMIIMDFTQANYDNLFMQLEPNKFSTKLFNCPTRCVLKCGHVYFIPPA